MIVEKFEGLSLIEMLQTPLKATLEKFGVKDFSMCLYPAFSKIQDTLPRPIFHYHLEKTAGMAITTAVDAALFMDRHANQSKLFFHRFSDQTYSVPDILKENSSKLNNPNFVFASYIPEYGRQKFGIHEKFDRNWQLMTFLRDPFERAVSFYFYLTRRGQLDEAPSESGFIKWANSNENFCYFTQMLSEPAYDGSNIEELFQHARKNIEKFEILGTMEDIEQVMLGIWTRFNLVPFVSGKLHSNPFKKVDLEFYREEFREKHHFDYALYDFAKQNTRLLMEPLMESDFDLRFSKPLMMLGYDSQQNDAAKILLTGCHMNVFQYVLGMRPSSFVEMFDKIAQTSQNK